MARNKLVTVGLAIFVLLLSLHFGNEAYIRFDTGTDFFGMIIASLLTLSSLIILGNLIKELS
ncbi:MAG: hypothetical protein KAK00_07470 [Nanoarchaeota archaeon]|nr:hypothetical protein [Thermodesulfovibrionia bacterium]MCK5283221.1 hypothetical protein [Nanoarchaeota archaeon]